jgi:hypothetical protein
MTSYFIVAQTGGWFIQIYLDTTSVRVSHVKSEQSVVPDRYSFKWELMLVFDPKVEELRSVSVRVLDIHFGENESRKDRERISSILTNWGTEE